MKTQQLNLVILSLITLFSQATLAQEVDDSQSETAMEQLLDEAAALWKAQPSAAKGKIRQVLALSCRGTASPTLGKAYKQLADAHKLTGENQTAIAYFDSAAAVYRQLTDTLKWDQTIFETGALYYRMSRMEGALSCFEQSYQLLKAYSSTPQKKTLSRLNALGVAYKNLGDDERALYFLRQALQLFETPADYRAAIINNIKNIYLNRGQLDSALLYGYEALRINRKLKQNAEVIYNHTELANIYGTMGAKEEMLEQIRLAKQLAEKQGDDEHNAAIYKVLGDYYGLPPQQTDSAAYYHHKYIRTISPQDTFLLLQGLNNITEVHSKSGIFDSASVYATQTLRVAKTVSNHYFISSAYYYLSCIHLNQQDAEKALADILCARDTAVTYNHRVLLPDIYLQLALVYEQMDSSLQAYTAYKEYARLKDAFFSRSTYHTAQEIAKMEAIRQKEKEYTLQVKSAKIGNTWLRRTLLIATLAFITLIILSSLWFRRRESRLRRFVLNYINRLRETPGETPPTARDPIPVKELHNELLRLQTFINSLKGQQTAGSQAGAVKTMAESKIEYLESLNFSISHDLKRYALQLEQQLRRLNSLQQAPSTAEIAPLQATTKGMIEFLDQLKKLQQVENSSTLQDRVSLQDLVQDILENLSPDKHYPGTQIQVETLPEVETDPLLLRQALVNLLENALKYSNTQPHPQVAIGCRNTPSDHYLLYVRDNGPGVPPAQAERIFEPFFRAGNTDASGSGLGLAIAKTAIEKLGGSLRVEQSNRLGCTFLIGLPG